MLLLTVIRSTMGPAYNEFGYNEPAYNKQIPMDQYH